jgi:hypothetical protein
MIKIQNMLFAIVTATLLTGCCWTDHSDTIREVAEPMLKELDAFYKENKRHPNVKERDIMLKEVGCEMDGDECLYDGDKILIEAELYNKDYHMGMTLEKSYCYFYLNEDGSIDKISCYKNPCIKLGQ